MENGKLFRTTLNSIRTNLQSSNPYVFRFSLPIRTGTAVILGKQTVSQLRRLFSFVGVDGGAEKVDVFGEYFCWR